MTDTEAREVTRIAIAGMESCLTMLATINAQCEKMQESLTENSRKLDNLQHEISCLRLVALAAFIALGTIGILLMVEVYYTA